MNAKRVCACVCLVLLQCSACARRPDAGARRVRIAVGGQNQLIYLPTTLARELGFYRDEGDELAAFGGHLNGVIVKARDDVGAAADERLQRLRPALKILQLDVQSFRRVQPELLRERRRQIDHLILAADREAHVRAVRRAARARHGKHEGHERHKGKEREEGCPSDPVRGPCWCVRDGYPFHRSNHRSSRVTPALTMTTTTASTVMPAKTPVVSNVPSACEIT